MYIRTKATVTMPVILGHQIIQYNILSLQNGERNNLKSHIRFKLSRIYTTKNEQSHSTFMLISLF